MEVQVKQDILTVNFQRKVDYTIAFTSNNIIDNSNKISFQFVELSFAKTSFITLPGAMYILLIVFGIVNNKRKNGLNVETRISGCTENILKVLSNFGLINILKTYGNLVVDTYTAQLNNEKTRYWKSQVKRIEFKLDTLYWPISIIPVKDSSSFEGDIATFFNNFIDYYNMLIKHGMMKSVKDEEVVYTRKGFISAINESTKNVWDHSESWGAASIYSNVNQKTTFCLFDYGIGFINSYIKRKGLFERHPNKDKEILKWLFEEGNTTDEINNHGRGLKRIAKFTDSTGGVLLIRTDKYILQYSSQKGLDISEKPYFPGTQLMINF